MQDILPWQQSLWHALQGYIASQRIPQAILLTGSAGLGKRRLAELYTGVLLCLDPLPTHRACGACAACKLLAADTHPDYLLLEPEEPGKTIGIDKIRQLIVRLALKPQFEAFRLVIIQPADMLNKASANAFLKCLEEPTERTCFILISEQAAKLPATIRSRCQKIHCPAPDEKLALPWLEQQGVGEDAGLLLRIAHGSPLLARQYAERQMIQIRQGCFQAWRQVAAGKTGPLQLADEWQKQQNVEPAVLLDWQIGWIMDIIKLLQQTDAAEIANPDFKNPLQVLAGQLALKPLYLYYDTLLRHKALLATQLNRQLLFERLLVDWARLNTGLHPDFSGF
ncbi:MAG: DNA polymerase III subunit delta' [Methylococcales bacterium]|nr:DNA polymerase III subunit delta' [Methylococcales bacterium]